MKNIETILKIWSKIELTDSEFNILKNKVKKEMNNQYSKFGKQKHSFEMWYLILMEEIAEISQEFIKFKFDDIENLDNVKYEMLQSITLLIQMYFGMKDISFKKRE